MNAKTVFTFAGGVVVGLIIGVWLFSGSSPSPQATAPVAPAQPQVDKIKLQRDIAQLEELVKGDAGNYQAWKRLGDAYFDIDEPKKSIRSYRKALDIDDSDPNVLTDLGVMYRKTGEFDKAIELFDKAIEKGPNHTISRLNKGVVYLYDLKDYEKGIAAWEEFLKMQPTGQQADAVRQDIEQFRQLMTFQEGGGELPPDHPPIAPPGDAAQDTPQDPAGYFPKPEAQ